MHLKTAGVISITLFAYGGAAFAQCTKDTDCKGDRICQAGTCVTTPTNTATAESPSEPVPPPEPQTVIAEVPAEPAPEAPAPAPIAAPAPPPPPPAYVPPPPAPAAREEKSSYFRLNLELRPFGYSWTRTEYPEDQEYDQDAYYEKDSTVQAGVTPGVDFGLGLAYSHKRHATVGLRFLLGVSSTRPTAEDLDGNDLTDDTDIRLTVFQYSVLPYFEYAFGKGPVRPFITVTVGLRGSLTKETYESSDSGDDYSEVYSLATNLFSAGVGGGVHFFVGDRASLDLWLLESIGVGSQKRKDEEDYNGDTSSDEEDRAVILVQSDLFLGLSIWI